MVNNYFTMHSDVIRTVTLRCFVFGKGYRHRFFYIFMKIHGYALKTSDSQKRYEISKISKMKLQIKLSDKRCVSKPKY